MSRPFLPRLTGNRSHDGRRSPAATSGPSSFRSSSALFSVVWALTTLRKPSYLPVGLASRLHATAYWKPSNTSRPLHTSFPPRCSADRACSSLCACASYTLLYDATSSISPRLALHTTYSSCALGLLISDLDSLDTVLSCPSPPRPFGLASLIKASSCD